MSILAWSWCWLPAGVDIKALEVDELARKANRPLGKPSER